MNLSNSPIKFFRQFSNAYRKRLFAWTLLAKKTELFRQIVTNACTNVDLALAGATIDNWGEFQGGLNITQQGTHHACIKHTSRTIKHTYRNSIGLYCFLIWIQSTTKFGAKYTSTCKSSNLQSIISKMF